MNINTNGKTLIMGILNVTPDSFSDGGNYTAIDRALAHAKQMVSEGADIIDVGGESTRPGHIRITAEEEISRVVPVIKALVDQLDTPISIDTYKSEVAEAAVLAGAHIINDIWGAKHEPAIAEVAAKYKVPIILMHNRNDTSYVDFWKEVRQDMEESVQIALGAGVKSDQIWLDPGIGFGKTTAHNIEMMQLLEQFVALGYPVLLGTSRKSLIGKVLNVPVSERLAGSLATVCYGVEKGCQIVRVHDVKETFQAIRMMDVLLGKTNYEEMA
ncbi:dihydropteroate synthase [Planomicrobium sp. CPCC 101110]|uniref:dihydropteroate synthase n=1 Tax=Planomicrobium sp. CPCC 101110 TaxID=2599619 RepID=UPI0011B77D99|nr:dihydropteroate synthase [Planomicrobium sp. CPCC 101110]TWT28638.1 dihydropteroate synthase [Planomicrobium sp. CPCC 101110]